MLLGIVLTNNYGSVIYPFRFRLYTRDFAAITATRRISCTNLSLSFIGLRYMRGRAADRFGRFVFWLSTIGITLG